LEAFAPRLSGQDFEKSILASRHRGSIYPQLPSHRPESGATPELGCGLFKKSAVTTTSNNCSAKKDVKPDQVQGAITSLSMLSYRKKCLLSPLYLVGCYGSPEFMV
jgi:hypothetical protein